MTGITKKRLTRRQAAAALTAAGFPTTEGTLKVTASRGGGPEYEHYGRWTLYDPDKLFAWAEKRCKPAIHSTSERNISVPR
jgi:hypothetical protein